MPTSELSVTSVYVFRLTKRACSYAGLNPPLSWWVNDIHDNKGGKEIHPREFVIMN